MGFMDKYKNECGGYTVNNINYIDDQDALVQGVFDFCGCGLPDRMLLHVLEHMEALAAHLEYVRNYSIYNDSSLVNPLSKYYDTERIGEAYFIWYWLDKMGFTIHGGTVPGWLTDEGQELLEWLRAWKKDYDQPEEVRKDTIPLFENR